MKILFDECVPWPLHRMLTEHQCSTAQREGWQSIKNGTLLNLAESHFDLFLTSDQNLRDQQNLAGRKIAILELSTNKLRPLIASTRLIVESIAQIKPGDFVRLTVP